MKPPRKFNTLVVAPVFSRSGYGQWADNLAPALINYPHFNVDIEGINFGNNLPRQFPMPHDALVQSKLLTKKLPKAYDVCVTINLPTHVIPSGNMFNINMSAGIETDRLPDYMMSGNKSIVDGRTINFPGVNNWDLSILMSHFAKQVYFNSNIKPTKAVEVLNAAVDTSVFKVGGPESNRVNALLAEVEEQEAFLFVGQRTHPAYGLDRKNQDALVTTFCEAFKGQSHKPALILKTNGVNFSCYDRDANIENMRICKRKAQDNDCNVYIIHGELSDLEMNALYNHKKIIAGISFTRGEGYGLPLLQTTLAGKPVIVSNYSGHLDFLDDMFVPLEGSLAEIPERAVSQFFIKGSKWFEVDIEKAKKTMQNFLYGNREAVNAKAKILAAKNAFKFSLDEQTRKLHKMLDHYLLGE